MVMFSAELDDSVDFFFGDAERFPLLTAAQEKQYDEQKWEFAHQALLELTKHPEGKQFIADFCRAAVEQPADIERF